MHEKYAKQYTLIVWWWGKYEDLAPFPKKNHIPRGHGTRVFSAGGGGSSYFRTSKQHVFIIFSYTNRHSYIRIVFYNRFSSLKKAKTSWIVDFHCCLRRICSSRSIFFISMGWKILRLPKGRNMISILRETRRFFRPVTWLLRPVRRRVI